MVQSCCRHAMGDIDDFFDLDGSRDRLASHHDLVHLNSTCTEGVLSRLWPFQEIILSDNIQFCVCQAPSEKGAYNSSTIASYSLSYLLEDLHVLTEAWAMYGNHGLLRVRWDQRRFLHAFFNLGTVSRDPANRSLRQFPFTGEIWVHGNSTRRTTKSRDFILAIMAQYHFYTAPANARQMTFGQLFLDCCLQLETSPKSDFELAPLLTSRLDLARRIPIATDNIPEPFFLCDFVKLLRGPIPPLRIGSRSSIPIELPWRREIQVQTVVETNGTPEVPLCILQCIRNSKILWERAHSGELRELTRKGQELTNGFKSSKNEKQASVHRFSQKIYEAVEFVYTVFSSTKDGKTYSEILLHLMQLEERKVPFQLFGSIARLSALITCGLGVSAFDWSIQNLTLISVTVNGRSFLGLAPTSVVQPGNESEFSLIEGEGYLGFERWTLVARNAEMELGFYSVCLFPPDILIELLHNPSELSATAQPAHYSNWNFVVLALTTTSIRNLNVSFPMGFSLGVNYS